MLLIDFIYVFAATASTFIRFFPKIKARYDYGLLIFILTFALVSVSGFRDDEILELAHKRLSTILIGGSACVVLSILVCPVWAGADFHNLIALNIEKLGNFLQGNFIYVYIYIYIQKERRRRSCFPSETKPLKVVLFC